jgi:hypothetical protein
MEPLVQPTALEVHRGKAPPTSTAARGPEVARPTQFAFWRAYLTTTRPYLFPISGLAGLTGMSSAQVGDP